MIQRIQSIYLFIASLICAWAFMYPPVLNFEGIDLAIAYRPIYMAYGYLGIAVIAFISIFLFKNRKTQMGLIRIAVLLNIVLLGFFVYWFLSLPGESLLSKKGIELIIPIISIVLLVMANKAIKKDDKLVKSVDRLR